MKKILTSVCAILDCEHLLSNEGKVTLEDGQLDSLEAAISADRQTIQDLQGQVQTLTEEKQALADANRQLTAEVAALKQRPADTTAHVVNDHRKEKSEDMSEVERYFESRSNAKELFDLVP